MHSRDTSVLQPVRNLKPFKHVEGTQEIERFFRAAAELDVDKDDIKRYLEFIEQKVIDILLMGQHTAKANDRVRVEPWDLPITKGLQESIHTFESIDAGIGLAKILVRRVPEPEFDLPYSDETDARLPYVAGGLSLALAKVFKILDPEMKNPDYHRWEQALGIFDRLL